MADDFKPYHDWKHTGGEKYKCQRKNCKATWTSRKNGTPRPNHSSAMESDP